MYSNVLPVVCRCWTLICAIGIVCTELFDDDDDAVVIGCFGTDVSSHMSWGLYSHSCVWGHGAEVCLLVCSETFEIRNFKCFDDDDALSSIFLVFRSHCTCRLQRELWCVGRHCRSWGVWSGSAGNRYSEMKYEHGQNCWNGPDRSATVSELFDASIRCNLCVYMCFIWSFSRTSFPSWWKCGLPW